MVNFMNYYYNNQGDYHPNLSKPPLNYIVDELFEPNAPQNNQQKQALSQIYRRQ